jgi:hypothetical protein
VKRKRPVVSRTVTGNLRILIPKRLLGKVGTSEIEGVERTTPRHFSIVETDRPGVRSLLIDVWISPNKPTRRRNHRTPVVDPTECPEADDEGGMSEYRQLGYEWP